MNKMEALRLKPGAVVYYAESSRGSATWWGRLLKVTPKGGLLVEPFPYHWRDGAVPGNPLLTEAWSEVGPDERWIPCQWVERAEWQ